MIADKVYQLIIAALAVVIIVLTLVSTIYVVKFKNASLEIARLESVNQTKTEDLQDVADSSGSDFTKIEEKHNDTTKIIERRFETIVEKNVPVLNTECIDDDTYQLLQELHVTRAAGEPETTLPESDTAAGENRETPQSSTN